MSGPQKPSSGKFTNMACDIEQGRKEYDIVEYALEVAAEIGVTMPTRPVYQEDHLDVFPGAVAGHYFDGRLPTTVRRLNLDQLSNMYAMLQAWYGYLSAQLSEWKIRKSQTKAIMDNTYAYLSELYKSSGRPVTSAQSLAKHDYRYVEDSADHEKSVAVYSIIEASIKTASKNLDLTSREITIRGMELESARKGRGFYNRTDQPRGYVTGGADAEKDSMGAESKIPHKSRWD